MASEVGEWYDDFSVSQVKTSVNLRHYTIFNRLVEAGLKRNSNILEIGCGIGTLTGLIHSYITKGTIAAADISEKSLRIAQENIKSDRIKFILSDMSDFEENVKYDFIIMPDVLEHIPINAHRNLFGVLTKHMHDESRILIHLPHPKAIEYLQKNHPEKLQIIDQAIYPDLLTHNLAANNLLVTEYHSYGLFHNEIDYTFITICKNIQFQQTELTKKKIILKKQFERIKYYMSLLK